MQQEKSNRRRIFLIIGGVLIVIAIAIALVVSRSANQTEATATQETVTAFIGNLSASAAASGKVTPRREATLSVETPGRVETVHVRIGDSVAEGDVLMELDTSNLALNVASAKENLKLKEPNLPHLL